MIRRNTMFENALTLRGVSAGAKITYKTLISAGLIALAVILPQIVHMALGQPGGVQWLPMYLPVLIGGCLLGTGWGMAVGIMSPICSFLITSAMGQPMPIAARLPYMVAELAVFALVSGLFSKKISKRPLLAFAAVVCAELFGRAFFLGLAYAFQSVSMIKGAMVWSQILAGWKGLALQTVLVPLIIIALSRVIKSDKE